MKKSLSLLVAIAMVFSMFATVVSAAGPEEGQSAGQYLNQLGVIKGNGTDLKEDQTWKRQDIVVLLSRLLGVEAAAKATAKSHEFKDVTDKNYDGYISWAVKEGLVQGKGNGKFGYGDELKTQEFYALVLRAFKVEVAYEDVPAKAVELKLAAEGTDFAAVPTRGATYSTIVTALNTEVPGTGKTLGETLGLIEGAAVSATQAGVKLITVKFNKAVDPAKAKFAVKNGTATREVAKATFAEDNKSVALETVSKLQDGASTVTVSGVSDKDIVAEFVATAEKVTEIQFTSDKLAVGTKTGSNEADYGKVVVGYKIVNQFNEDVTKTAGGSLSFQVGKGDVTVNASNGFLTITGDVAKNIKFQVGETVYVSGILNLTTYGVTVTKAFTVGQQAVVDTVDVLSLYHPENKELTTSSNFEEYYILLDAKDQYNNNVTLAQLKAGVFASASNPNLFTVNIADTVSNVGPKNDKFGIPLKKTEVNSAFVFDGTNTVRVQTLFGQKTDSIDVPVKKAPTLTTFTLQAPDKAVSPGDVVKIPFTAADQNGAPMENFKDIDGKIHFSASNGNDKISLKQDYVTKKAFVEWVAGPEGPNFLTATVSGTASMSQLSISVVTAGVPSSLAGLKDVSSSLVVGGKVTIEPKHVVIKDQHDRDVKLADLLPTVAGSTYSYYVTIAPADGNGDVVTGFGSTQSFTFVDKDSKVELTAAAKGTERLKIELFKVGQVQAVASSEAFAFTVVDSNGIQSDSYVIADTTKIKKDEDSKYDVEVKVEAKRTNGEKVTLPASAYTVQALNGLTYDATTNKISAENVVVDLNKEVKASFSVLILATNEVLVKEVTVANEASKVTTIELKDGNNLKAADGVIRGTYNNVTIQNIITSALKIKDQFGVEYTPAAGEFYVSISEPDDAVVVDGAKLTVVNNGALDNASVAPSVQNIAVGDSYTVLFTSKTTGAKLKAKVVAVNAL